MVEENLITKEKKNRSFLDKRLLVITPVFPNRDDSYFGGIFVKNQIDALKSYFKEVTIIAPVLFSARLLPEDKMCHDYSYDNVRVFFPRALYIPWPLYRRYNISRIFFDNREQKVRNLIEKQHIKFDIIHAHFIWPSAYIGKKLKQKYDVPLVITAHGYDVYEVPFHDSIWKDRVVFATKEADYFITVSQKNLAYFNELNIDISAQVIPNGYLADLFFPRNMNECRRRLSLPIDKKILLIVGNLVEVKGHRYLIEAMKEVVSKQSDVFCVILGKGPLESKLKRQIFDLGLEDSVVLVGGKPHEEIPLWINSCDLFVLPSLNEGNPTVMFECLGCGKPFIGTNVGGVSEIISNSAYGRVCEAGNPTDLAETILNALIEFWNFEEIAAYSKRFTWQNITEQLMKIYHNVLMNEDVN